MKKNAFALIILLIFIDSSFAQVSTSLYVNDTRSINELPNFSQHDVRADFKYRDVIGAPGQGVYSANLTISPWVNSENTGGKNYQLNFNEGGFFYRNAYPKDVKWSGWKQIVMADENGNVGIGLNNPSAKLTIQAGPDGYATPLKAISIVGPNSPSNTNSAQEISWDFQAAGSAAIRAYRGNSWDTYLQFLTNGFSGANTPQVRMHINGEGNVGIGNTNPQNKLDVNGTIHSKEVKVDMNGWSDFVFKKEYGLPTLEEVEKHISDNGHLKDIPSEEEVLKDGINLGEMNSKLLQKIEELTLYSIEQNKEIKSLKKENEILKELTERISKVESALEKR